jgi:hypothetical protein
VLNSFQVKVLILVRCLCTYSLLAQDPGDTGELVHAADVTHYIIKRHAIVVFSKS